MEDMQHKKGRGRPKKDNDPQNTPLLFSSDDELSLDVIDTYDGFDADGTGQESRQVGTVEGGRALFTIADRMEQCARLARRAKSESVRLQAMIKYSELEREQREAQGAGDIGEELLCLLAQVKGERPGKVVQDV